MLISLVYLFMVRVFGWLLLLARTILDLIEGDFTFTDTTGQAFRGGYGLVPVHTLRAGLSYSPHCNNPARIAVISIRPPAPTAPSTTQAE